MPEKKKKPTRESEAGGGVSVRMTGAIRQRAKVYAAVNGRSLMSIVDEAVNDYLKKRGA